MAHPEATVLANWITLSRFPLLALIILIVSLVVFRLAGGTKALR